jgi:hypothetical protein
VRGDVVPGAVFPDYEFPDHRAKRRTLSELQRGDPLVLVLSRGGYCPRDRRQHEGFLQLHHVGLALIAALTAVAPRPSRRTWRSNFPFV